MMPSHARRRPHDGQMSRPDALEGIKHSLEHQLQRIGASLFYCKRLTATDVASAHKAASGDCGSAGGKVVLPKVISSRLLHFLHHQRCGPSVLR